VTLQGLLDRGLGDRAALRIPDGAELTYGDLRRAAAKVARHVSALAVQPGESVAASFGNGPEILAAFFGVAEARAAYAPLNSAYTEGEFRFYLEDIGPKLLYLSPGGTAAARAAAAALGIPVVDLWFEAVDLRFGGAATAQGEARHATPDDVALFLHTSGTTSRPKGVPLTHGNLIASARNIQRWYGIAANDVTYCVMPLFHVHGLVFSVLAHLAAGAKVVMPERFSATVFWHHVRAYGATNVSAVPTIYRTLLLRAEEDGAPAPGGHTLRFMRSSSAPLPARDMLRLEERFGAPVIEAYSMTEAAHQMCANPLEGERRPGSAGVGAYVDVTILDAAGDACRPGTVGEVAVRGTNVMRGYRNNPEANALAFANGWFRTGDWGTLSSDGYLTLVGRLKELINRAGEKISPVEIDDVLVSHPGVAEAVAFAIADEKYGEVVGAALVLRDGTTVADVLAHAGARLAPFKVPTAVYVLEAIPRTATGKVQRRIVAESLKDRAPSET
jgi:acyl-CoA synthetase (AMP-forming)/AMP-acid ligase II